MKVLLYIILLCMVYSCNQSVNTEKDTSVINSNIDSLEDSPQIVFPDYLYPIKPPKENWQEDIGEVFLMLPDTIFKNESNFNHDFDYLTYEMKKRLVEHKKTLIDKVDCSIQLSKSCENNKCNCLDKDQKQMSIVLGCYNDTTSTCALDNVSRFQLNGWRKKNQSLIFTVNIGNAFFNFEESTLFYTRSSFKWLERCDKRIRSSYTK